jgi:pyruvate kinase
LTHTETRRALAGAERVYDSLERLRADVVDRGDAIFEGWQPRIERSPYLESARNLARYIALRRHDLRRLQEDLMPLGLSSLGRCEARVLENLEAVLATLAELVRAADPPEHPSSSRYFSGHRQLRRETDAALGPAPRGRNVRIMVTLPASAAGDYELVFDLVSRGMDLARINCGHGDPEQWRAMAANVRRAAAETGRSCRLCMDISGPRARTAKVELPHSDYRAHLGHRLLMGGGNPGREARFQCSLPGVLDQLEPGHHVWIDEGALGAVVEEKAEGAVLLRVMHARESGERLRAGKGLNFPETELRIDPLTPKDLADLDTVAVTADAIGYSFVQEPEDIERLQGELAERTPDWRELTLMAKIETRLAVTNLPELIVAGAGRQPLAVMIARGDLAVEIGPRRLAEMQEEMLWLCEAAHVPVIWATQVLDRFVHKGNTSRAELTDAAMAERAECVMLNKGRFIGEAVTLLDELLGVMEGHQFKKVSRMRALHAW